MDVESMGALNATSATPEQAAKFGVYSKAYVFMALLSVYVIVRGIRGAAARPFWFDELLTLTIAGQASLHDMWTVMRRGFDIQPPLFYLVERLALSIPIKKEIALRLPSILAFPCILMCVFAFVKKRSGVLIGCICALVLLSTSLFRTYTIEARPYSMVIACFAFALLCYQRLPSWSWTALFAISLMLAGALHYYAVFAMIPFWLAEGVTFLGTKKFRWPVWVALLSGILPLLASFPLLLTGRAYFGSHIVFANAPLSRVPEFYGSYFFIESTLGFGLAVASLVAIVWSRFSVGTEPSHRANGSDWAEGTLLIALNILPVITFVLVRLTHAALASRYVLAATIGIVLGIACGLSFSPPRVIALAAIFIVSSVGLHERSFWRLGHESIPRDLAVVSNDEFGEIRAFVQSGGHFDLRVVFAPGLIYTQTIYYSPASWTARLVYLTDEQKELAVEGIDSISLIIKALRDYMPMRVEDYSEFTAAHDKFLVYAEGADWVLLNLAREAASVRLLEAQGSRRLYLVEMHGLTGPTGVHP